MSSPAEHTLVQPDYATKPVTYLRDVLIKAISFVPRGANGKRWLLFKNEEGAGTATDELVEYSSLIKAYDPAASDDWEVAYVVIAEPGDVDKQKDVWDEAEIKKAAHEFIPSGGLLNFNHETMDSVGVLVENATALVDFDIETPDGTVETIKKGSWYIGVKPNPDIKAKIKAGEIGGMSVQGSAQREEVQGEIAKADKMDAPVQYGTTGEGVTKLQRILGVEETGKYNEVTESALIEWMKGRGVPGLPTIATVKMCLTESAAPAAAPPATVAAPVEGGDVPALKADPEGYNPASNDNVPPRPVGTPGINAATVNPDSPTEDLKALIAQSIREGNEGLEKFMAEEHGGSTVGDLYGRDISHADLWFIISKFILGTAPSIDANGDYENRGPEVEKGAWTGSHGGHDPDAKNGQIENLIRTFGKWARGKQSVAARKLLANGVVSTMDAANRLAAWLKDQWAGTTKWRDGGKLHKSAADDLRRILDELGESAEEVVAKMSNPEMLDLLSQADEHDEQDGGADDEEETANGGEVKKHPGTDAMQKIIDALKTPTDDPGHTVDRIKAIIAGPQETQKAQDPALDALTAALAEAVKDDDVAARTAAVSKIVQDFARYMARKGETKDSTAAAADSGPTKSPAFSGVPVGHAPTFLNKGEDIMTGPMIDEETARGLETAVSFLTQHFGVGASVEDAPAEVEKDAVPAELKGKQAPPFTGKDGGPKAAPADSPKAEGELEEALDDEGEDVSEDELLMVMNHLVDEVDALGTRLAALEQLDGKLDKLDDLAKAIVASDTEVSERVEKFANELTEVSKSVASLAPQEAVETLKKSLDSVAQRVDSIAKTPNRSGAIPVDAKTAPAKAPQAVAKSGVDADNPWADPTNNPFR